MPGLSQLKQFKSDLLSLGDEEKVRASRGEKPSTIPIPDSVKDMNDSDDFLYGIPEVTEDDSPAEESADEAVEIPEIEELPADESISDDFIPGLDELGDDLDLSGFDGDLADAGVAEPDPTPIEDMDLNDLLSTPAPEAPAEDDTAADAIPDLNMDDLPSAEDLGGDDLASLDDLSFGDDSADAATDDSLADLNMDDFNFDDPNAEFADTNSADIDLNDDLPKALQEEPDPMLQKIQEEKERRAKEEAEKSAETQGDDFLADLNLDDIADTGAEPAQDDFMNDLPDFGETSAATGDTDNFSLDGLDGLDDAGSPSSGDDAFEEMGDIDLGSGPLDPTETVSEEEGPVEVFDTSGIDNLDFSGDNGSSDFEFGSGFETEGDEDFQIPGFSDTATADLSKPKVDTPDFSKASEVDDEKDKPKNTFTDNEYKRFQQNLATYPLNVRIAIEELVVKNEFTDEAVFPILEKVLKKASARQVATELEKLLDIQLDVPRDFERRSATEYAAYKKSLEYQLKNRIIPGAILSAIAAILIFCIFTLTNNFIYKPVRASMLYNQGYALLQDNQYPQSESCFNKALVYKPIKKWFYKYAVGYRDHHQYDRARMMYRAILQRYGHDKPAGIDWAKMEYEDLQNYGEAERIIKREILDYHINDPEAILLLGDLYLEWGTDKDPSKFTDAKEQYDLIRTLKGDTDMALSRQMRYFIRTDNLRQVLVYKEFFMNKKKHLIPEDEIELSGYMLDKRYGRLRPSEESLRSNIEDVRSLLERALKSAPQSPVANYNMARYFINTSNGVIAKKYLDNSIKLFENQTRRNRRDTYKYINTYRLLGEQLCSEKEFLLAEERFGSGIEIFEKENGSSGFESDENVGHLYADLADIDYFIAADNERALRNYESAVNNKWDTSSVRYKIGYIQYLKQNYGAALGSFIKSHDTNSSDTHLLLALANTLSLSNDNYVARGYYERLIKLLDAEHKKFGILFPQIREDQADLVDTYMKASNNLGVTLSRLANVTGDSTMNAGSIVYLQESLRAWDALTRNQETMIRLNGSNLAEQNIKYISHPISTYEPEIYIEIPRTLYGEKGLEQ